MKTKQRQTMKSTQKQTSTDKHSHPEAMVNAAWVAGVYLNGWGVPQDYRKAHKWLKKPAVEGNTTAMVNLGRLYEQGLGVAQDYGKALEWYQKAVGAGNRDATLHLDRLNDQALSLTT